MKIKVDDKIVLELNETKQKVIKNDVASDIFQQDMERRVNWVLSHKYEKCFESLKKEWEPKLRGRVESIPLDPDSFAELVFSQPDYKDRYERNLENPLFSQ